MHMTVMESPGYPTNQANTPHGQALLFKPPLAAQLMCCHEFQQSRLELALWRLSGLELPLFVCGNYAPPGLAATTIVEVLQPWVENIENQPLP